MSHRNRRELIEEPPRADTRHGGGRSFRLAVAGLVAAAAALAGGCDGKLDVDAPAPAMMADTDTLPALPSSTLDIPLTYDLSPVVRALEAAVPKKFGNITERKQLSNKRMSVAFEASRDPFSVSLDGQTAYISAVVNYKGQGWYKPPVVGEVTGSCGIGGVRPRAKITLASDLRINPDWRLRGKTRITRVEPYSNDTRDQCRVTVFNINVTDRVIDATKNALEAKRPLIDQKIAALDIRSRFEAWWHLLEQPIPLTDSVWLTINPSAVRMGENVGVKKTLVTALGFSASPRVVTGPKPTVTETSLPSLYPAAVGNGLHILLEGVVGYDVATDLLRTHLVGKKFQRARQAFEVKDVRIFGIGGGKLALEVRFAGAAAGRIYLVGTPRYDASSNELYVPDLDYDIGSANLLVSGVEWVKHDDVRDFIRKQARWSIGDVMGQGKEQLLKGLNRDLADGVHLAAEVSRVQGLSVHPTRRNIRLRAQADAVAHLTVKQGK